ncbi:MAG: DUF460 domain-containing protein [Candidatus Bilamarchaeaceae archaeon]
MYLIVGVDAGIKTGYAILNLRGELIAFGVVKEVGYDDLVRIISSFGTPSVIATDVSPAPFFVKKIAARFAAPLFEPKKSLLVKDKKRVSKGIADSHVRDAYAAAIKAYHHYANRLKQIDLMIKNEDEKEKIKHLLIRGHAVGKL